MSDQKNNEKGLKVQFARGGNTSYQNRQRGGGYNNRRDDNYRSNRGGGFQRDFRKGPDDRPKGCFNCNKEGHFARQCPQPKKPRQFSRPDGGFRDRDDRRGGRDFRQNRHERRKSSSQRSRSPKDKKYRNRRRSSSSSSKSRSR